MIYLLNMDKCDKRLPRGISVLHVFYFLNASLFFLASLVFFEYLDIITLGKTSHPVLDSAIRLLLVITPLYIAFGLLHLKKDAYFLAIAYQLFFIINGVLTILHFRYVKLSALPIFEIVLKPDYKTPRIIDFFGPSPQAYLTQILGIVVGVIILAYLLAKAKIFTRQRS